MIPTPEEVNDAAKEFFPLFDIVHRNMPENCTVEDTIKDGTVCSMAKTMHLIKVKLDRLDSTKRLKKSSLDITI